MLFKISLIKHLLRCIKRFKHFSFDLCYFVYSSRKRKWPFWNIVKACINLCININKFMEKLHLLSCLSYLTIKQFKSLVLIQLAIHKNMFIIQKRLFWEIWVLVVHNVLWSQLFKFGDIMFANCLGSEQQIMRFEQVVFNTNKLCQKQIHILGLKGNILRYL